jgi:hypothetical protein
MKSERVFANGEEFVTLTAIIPLPLLTFLWLYRNGFARMQTAALCGISIFHPDLILF